MSKAATRDPGSSSRSPKGVGSYTRAPDALAAPVRQLQGHRRPIVLAHEVHRAGKGIEQGLDQRRLGIQGQWLVRARGAARGITVEIGRQHAVAEAQTLGERPPLVRHAGSVQADHRGMLTRRPDRSL